MPNQSVYSSTAEELLARFDHGDDTALRELHERFYPRLLHYGLMLCDREATVEDQIQEIFLWLLEKRGTLGHIRNVETYLFGALRNNLRRTAATAGRAPVVLPFPPPAEREASQAPDAELAEAERLRRAEIEFIRAQLAQLPTRRREVIYLRYVKEYGFTDIATIMGISSQVARNYATRALRTLRDRVAAYRRRMS